MRDAHAVAEVRAAESALMARLPEGALMQRAASGLAAVCAGLLARAGRTDFPAGAAGAAGVYGSRVVVLAGSGDNGGDALHAGARLATRGAVVTAIAAASRVHEGGTAALRGSGGRLIEAADDRARPAIAAADLIIDGLLGIGGRGGLREPAAGLAAEAEHARGLVVAADLPSGIDADTGEVAGAAVRADVTVTFGTWKPGLLIDPGASHAGVVELIDIGLRRYLGPPDVAAAQAADIAAWLPRPTAESDKYRRGVLGIVAGSERFTGAAQLSVGAAVRAGAGMVRLVSAPPAAAVVRQRWPEAIITTTGDATTEDATTGDTTTGDTTTGDTATRDGPAGGQVIEAAGRVQAWVAGPGMGTGEPAAGLLAAVLATSLPVLVDADGITLLADHRGLLSRSAPTLLTPHAGELARLLGADRADIEARRLRFATRAAAELGCTVLLKGSTTVIASPAAGQAVLVNPTGTSWLATAGSGDVLSGLAGALLAQGLEPLRAAAAAAYLHGIAARLAADGAPIGSSDLIEALPAAIRTVAGARGEGGPAGGGLVPVADDAVGRRN
jgi:ADP-dependent NAD(P)H-hydrate dehydratase / NAD(P)H-hydrate epimerase